MRTLTLKLNDKFVIGKDITITVLELLYGRVKLGVDSIEVITRVNKDYGKQEETSTGAYEELFE